MRPPRRSIGEFNGAVFRLSQQTGGAGKGLVTLMLALSAFKGAPSQSHLQESRHRRRRPRPRSSSKHDPAAPRERPRQVPHERPIQRSNRTRHDLDRHGAVRRDADPWRSRTRSQVTDFVRHKTIILHAGQSYLAPGPFKRP